MNSVFIICNMALEPEINREKEENKVRFTNKFTVTVISLAVGCIIGLSISLLSIADYTAPLFSLYSTTETNDGVGMCKNNVIKYAPLGAYPEGHEQAKAALHYCDSLA
jgi:hypothetical protein